MFESFKFNNPEPKSKKENEILLNYAEVAKNRKEIEERKLAEERKKSLENLGKEAEIQAGVEKAREILEKDFEHRS